MGLHILVINSGSSSIKFSLIEVDTHKTVISGLAEKLGLETAVLHAKHNGETQTIELEKNDHETAMQAILKTLQEKGLGKEIKAVGHRVVHGGEYFSSSTIVTPEVIKAIEKCVPYAPLHNPANLIGITGALHAVPELPQVAVFDTAFHQTLPQHAYLYAVPTEWYKEHGVRRYGFHGISYRFVTQEAASSLQIPLDNSAFVCAHLGNGASITAILNGKSVDTSMGFTPLEGLVMGTRSGDIDPALIGYLSDVLKKEAHEIVDMLNKKSGLLGLSGLSNDMRELEAAAANGDERAKTAIEIFVFRLAKYIAAMSVSLPRVDALIFTGGIGENSVLLRRKVIERLAVLGYFIDEEANGRTIRGKAGIITNQQSKKAIVINTNEELMIAMDTAALVKS
ncbi:acetate kinase [Pinibacter aurantiacus]|uniref:Acetate kinase n=1 Tax=Pinibacter aurantiacus TaxID=2851599 RepID=A0A9E2W825_9BACT|nr:acetate kinase [Pinibacter aurantiacus]MBV4357407.1 acetate kinase [Pinibacter aurantiacus]